jgi:hypothetical protein
MSAYRPLDAVDLAATIALLVIIIGTGFAVARVGPLWLARLSAWALVLTGVASAERWNADEPAGFRMLAIIGDLRGCPTCLFRTQS